MASEIERINKTLRRRRISKTVTVLIVVAVLAVIAYFLTRMFLRVGVIAVENTSRYTSSELLAKCDTLRGEPILQFNRNKAKDRLQTSLPYIKNVIFSIAFPNRLNISVEGATARYSVSANGVYICLDEDFKVLEITPSPVPGILQIEGLTFESDIPDETSSGSEDEPAEKAYMLGKTIDLNENIEVSVLAELLYILETNDLFDRVTYIDFSKKYNLVFYLDGIIEVELGTSENLDKKISMLIEILSRNPSDRRAVINVRNPSEGRYRAIN